MSVRRELEERLGAIPGLTRKGSRFGDGQSYFLGSREIVHFHGDTRMDVRLTREEVRRRRAAGVLDPRLTIRGGSAHWVEVSVREVTDLLFALELVDDAVRANSE